MSTLQQVLSTLYSNDDLLAFLTVFSHRANIQHLKNIGVHPFQSFFYHWNVPITEQLIVS